MLITRERLRRARIGSQLVYDLGRCAFDRSHFGAEFLYFGHKCWKSMRIIVQNAKQKAHLGNHRRWH